MNVMRHGLAAFFVLCAGLALRAQEKPPDFQAQYDQLTAEFGAAQQEYYKPYQEAKTEEESQKIQLDPAKDPRKLFEPRFEELARQAKGTEVGCQCWVWVFSNDFDDPAALQRAFDALGGEYVQSPALERCVQMLGWYGEQIGRDKADGLLEKLIAQSPHEAVRAAALFTQASMVFGNSDSSADARQAARAKLERVQKEFAKTRYAAQAEGLIFEADHLQIGMIAPDFEALDQDGKPWKLSDYRGKVVVVDFWGYW